jgi:diguanylate cyclase (GGDEF)-like protein
VPNRPERDELERLQRLLAAADQRRDALELQLAEAQEAQQQLQRSADDFSRIYAEASQRLQQMTALYQVSIEISTTVDPREVLVRTVVGLERLVAGVSAAIYLSDQPGGPFYLEAAAGRFEADGLPATLSPAEGPLGHTLESRGPVVAQRQPSGWLLALPLVAGSHLLGGVLLAHPADEAFDEDDRRLAEMVVAQTALALQNARLATTDGLTGLYNRRYFEQALALECERARRSDRPLGLLMIDVDHFKRFNDRHGHPAGDAVLQRAASTLASAVRRTDILARVGGEEFAAILPESDLSAVATAAERLRRVVAQDSRLDYAGSVLPPIKVSIGGSSLGPDQLSPRALLEAADRALWGAKRGGRNRSLVVAEEESADG